MKEAELGEIFPTLSSKKQGYFTSWRSNQFIKNIFHLPFNKRHLAHIPDPSLFLVLIRGPKSPEA